MKTKKQEREDFERVVYFLKKMIALAEEEIEDCSYGEKEVRMGARVGCDCGCGGEFLTEEDFVHERDESKYEILLKFPEELRDLFYYYTYCLDHVGEDLEKELHKVAKKWREELEEVLYGD